eukprot:NODE_142_length_15935_cov_1.439126.p10 type:complete len:198 gc:universal NODE_142_length_15935_cov_1.439126:14111-13518(-)
MFSMFYDLAATVLTISFFGLNLKHFDLWPTISTFANCIIWLKYGVLNFSFSMIIVNLVGVLCSLFGIYKLSSRSRTNSNHFRNSLIVIIMVLLYLKFQLYPVALYYCGLLACTLTIFMFGSPLGHLKKVIATKNNSLLNYKRIVLGTFVSLSWMLVGYELSDSFVIVPNMIGLILSCIQLLVYLIYRGPYKDYRQVN